LHTGPSATFNMDAVSGRVQGTQCSDFSGEGRWVAKICRFILRLVMRGL
jgi:hypothetical protein